MRLEWRGWLENLFPKYKKNHSRRFYDKLMYAKKAQQKISLLSDFYSPKRISFSLHDPEEFYVRRNFNI